MRKSTLVGCALVFTLLVPVAGLHAQTNFSVNVNVTCDDPELRSLVRSYFSRELRELGDVRVDKGATSDYIVDVKVLKQGRLQWAMSVLVSARLQPEALGSSASLSTDFSEALASYQKMLDHSLTAGDSSGDLGTEISDIAKSFDREVLKPRRKALKGK